MKSLLFAMGTGMKTCLFVFIASSAFAGAKIETRLIADCADFKLQQTTTLRTTSQGQFTHQKFEAVFADAATGKIILADHPMELIPIGTASLSVIFGDLAAGKNLYIEKVGVKKAGGEIGYKFSYYILDQDVQSPMKACTTLK